MNFHRVAKDVGPRAPKVAGCRSHHPLGELQYSVLCLIWTRDGGRGYEDRGVQVAWC